MNLFYVSGKNICCSNLFIAGFGKVLKSYPDLFGTYYYHGKYNDKSAYKMADREYYLFRDKNDYTMKWYGVEDEFWMVIYNKLF